MGEILLEVNDVTRAYGGRGRDRQEVLKGISFRLEQGKCLGLVGESGCGKSTLCRILSGLEKPDSGQVLYHGKPVGSKAVRGKIQMVFQNSSEAVNHHQNVLQIVSEPLKNLFHMNRKECQKETARLLKMVGIAPEEMKKYPRQFSGGQLQRICIARALGAKPGLLLLDEPLSSLDVSVQAQILNLFADLRNDLNLTCILVSHDLRAVYYLADEVLRLSEGTVKAIPSSDTIIRPERF